MTKLLFAHPRSEAREVFQACRNMRGYSRFLLALASLVVVLSRASAASNGPPGRPAAILPEMQELVAVMGGHDVVKMIAPAP